ncbi:LPS export ABC transporter permease LptG [Poseidonocella sedimentorum]|uniref:Lipopolysaccharide export system permease protein n=1 Tax=Poseidonocella sedimentorum TaxID=871652 RepID=A0A1I6DZB5_9RHOB|nr:LPS export ABC transporter permease LptG [Poseidonocella sedimentorum]SFR10763.1 lipopolysaccharide export system permease protein [Poseidonocella sedimentorum]
MILHRYFARKFLLTFLAVFAIFAAFLALLDLVEQIRRFDSDEVGFRQALGLTALKIPETLYEFLPLIMILSGLSLFLGVARSSELVVTRAAGRSAMRALIAPFLVALVIGGVAIAVVNPLIAATIKRYDVLSAQYRDGIESVFSISREGVWLRQGSAEGQTVIRANSANADGTQLFGVSFVAFDPGGTPVRRIEAGQASLSDGYWLLDDAKSWPLAAGSNAEVNAERSAEIRVASTLTRERIAASVGSPATIPFWDLRAYIRQLDAAGFSTRRHNVWFQTELARPLFLASMVLIAAAFTMRHTRFGSTGLMVLLAVLLAFTFYFIRNFALILGENGQIPVLLAAWAPPLAAIFLSLGLILHLEDG